ASNDAVKTLQRAEVTPMQHSTFRSHVPAFLVAIVIATVLGAIVQTQYNLDGLTMIGVEITFGQRVQTTLRDIFSGFSPSYAGYVVLPSLLLAFLAAAL